MPATQPFSEYASVIVQVDAPGLVQPFTYGVPPGMTLAVGDAIMAPFGGSPVLGYVVGVSADCPRELRDKVKPIEAKIANGAAFDQNLLDLARWVAADTFTDIRDTIKLIAPEIMASRITSTLRLAEDWEARLAGTRSTAQIRAAKTLAALGGSASAAALARALSRAPDEPAVASATGAPETLWDFDLPAGADTSQPLNLNPSPLQGKGSKGPLDDRGRPSDEGAVPEEKLTPIIAELRLKAVIIQQHEIVPPKARPKVVRVLSLACDPTLAAAEAKRLDYHGATRQAALLRALLTALEDSRHSRLPAAERARAKKAGGDPPAGIPMSGLAIAVGSHAAAQSLADRGLVSYFEIPVHRNPFRVLSDASDRPPPLTDAQQAASRAIGAHLSARKSVTLLLHGVTGSGKTEVYLDAAQRALDDGRSVLVLVPEIGLTTQLLDLFKSRFGDETVAVLHSALSPGERYDEWRRIKLGAARVVLGARSSVFAPLSNLGLIIIDEEHDGSFKQDNAPRYHARDVAIKRSAVSEAVLVLGSATPSLESHYSAVQGAYELLQLPERIDNRPLPQVHVVDLRAEFGRAGRTVNTSPLPSPWKGEGARRIDPSPPAPLPSRERGAGVGADTTTIPLASTGSQVGGVEASTPSNQQPSGSVFSARLAEAIGLRLERREQVILFLNRRGFATFLLCRDCGHTPHCPNCAVTLTYHHAARLLQCHHCDFRGRALDSCPKCEGHRIRPFGLGTEKVEESVRAQFQTARLLRMDRDTMARKGAHAAALRSFRLGEADILIGTQMVAKGLDFPNVTLVGVVSADTALNVPDFRASERAFQLLTQVAGRAGRGRTPGEVIIQTFNPEHESVLRATHHDYAGFYEDEIAQRRELLYPPFSHMANLVASDPDELQAQHRIEAVETALRASIDAQRTPVSLLGPATCPLSRLKSRYRWHLVLRAAQRDNIHTVLRHALRSLSSRDRASLSIDIDPLTML